ncbi:MAG: fibronectin type III domain-containing protein, partial [Bdellovibrionota bacterium]
IVKVYFFGILWTVLAYGAPAQAPSNLKTTVSNGAVSLSWDPVDGAKSYVLYSNVPSQGTEIKTDLHRDIIFGSGDVFRYPFLPGGQTYRFAVSAIDTAGEGPLSAEVSAELPRSAIPGAKWVSMFDNKQGDTSLAAIELSASGAPVFGGYLWDSNLDGTQIGQLKNAWIASVDGVAGALSWSQSYGTNDHDRILGIDIGTDGSIFATGASGFVPACRGGGGGYDANVAKYSSTGVLAWSFTIGTSLEDLGYEVIAESSGGAYVFGRAGDYNGGVLPSNISTSAFIAKVDSAGELVWFKNYPSLVSPGSLVLASDGYLYANGRTFNTPTPLNQDHLGYLMKIDSSGTIIWEKFIAIAGATTDNWAFSGGTSMIEPTDDGGFYLGGNVIRAVGDQTHVGGTDPVVARVDGTGNIVWIRSFGTIRHDTLVAIKRDPKSGNLVLTGDTMGAFTGYSAAGFWDFYIATMDPNGNLLTLKQYGTAETEGVSGLDVGSDGAVTLIGSALGELDGKAYRYPETGKQVVQARLQRAFAMRVE